MKHHVMHNANNVISAIEAIKEYGDGPDLSLFDSYYIKSITREIDTYLFCTDGGK